MEEREFETNAIRMQMERTANLEHSVPLYLTSSFVFEDAEDMRASFAEEKERNIYSRYANPNTSELIVEPNTLLQDTIWSPLSNSAAKVLYTAAIPDAKAKPASAPSI